MTKPRKVPRYDHSSTPRELQIVYDLAVEMSHSDSYAEIDEESQTRLGRKREITDSLNWVRKTFGLKGNKET